MTRPKVDELLQKSYSLTLGRVVEELEGSFDPALGRRLAEAVEHRNFLVHRFWFERCHLMYSKSGLLGLHADLHGYRDLFAELDTSVMEVVDPILRAMGVTDESLTDHLERLMQGEPDQPPLSHRMPHTQERIARIWDVPVGNASSFVFEGTDGLLWQLCDVGLGWTRFDKPGNDWQES